MLTHLTTNLGLTNDANNARAKKVFESWEKGDLSHPNEEPSKPASFATAESVELYLKQYTSFYLHEHREDWKALVISADNKNETNNGILTTIVDTLVERLTYVERNDHLVLVREPPKDYFPLRLNTDFSFAEFSYTSESERQTEMKVWMRYSKAFAESQRRWDSYYDKIKELDSSDVEALKALQDQYPERFLDCETLAEAILIQLGTGAETVTLLQQKPVKALELARKLQIYSQELLQKYQSKKDRGINLTFAEQEDEDRWKRQLDTSAYIQLELDKTLGAEEREALGKMSKDYAQSMLGKYNALQSMGFTLTPEEQEMYQDAKLVLGIA
jgi:hypothetical protein